MLLQNHWFLPQNGHFATKKKHCWHIFYNEGSWWVLVTFGSTLQKIPSEMGAHTIDTKELELRAGSDGMSQSHLTATTIRVTRVLKN